MRKKKKKNKINYTKFLMVFIMMFSLIIAMITYWIYAYNHKYRNTKITSYNVNDYVYIVGDIVYLKNINTDINNEFIEKQKDILKNNVTYIDISKNLKKDILSIKISYLLDDKEDVITFNYDLNKKQIISNSDLLNKFDINYNDIALDIFDNYIKLNGTGKIVDAINDKELSYDEFNNNKEKYVIRIREKLPEVINLYLDNNGLYYNVSLSSIYDVCYYMDKDGGNIDRLIKKI